jgi:hypothetical protein
MFEPHSLLWHYLWLAPSTLLLFLAVIVYRRGLHRDFPVFFLFAVMESVTVLALYLIDVTPLFSAAFYWEADLVRLVIEVTLKFALIGEIFSRLCKPYAALSKMGQVVIQGVGAVLVLVAVLAASRALPGDFHPLIATSHRLTLADFIIECGLLLFIFLFAAYFRPTWERLALGIALGRGLAASLQLGTWAVLSYLSLSYYQREQIDFFNMVVYHLSIFVWYYYVLTTTKAGVAMATATSSSILGESDEPENNLDVWNRTLERLLQR